MYNPATVTRLRIVPLAILLALALPAPARAERLPTKIFTTADGLASNIVNRIVRDSHGYLWICTREGLSRFDGYSFTTYGIDDGLPGAVIKDLLETNNGLDSSLCAGASGYLLKNTPPARLLESLQDVAAGGAPMSPEIARRVVRLFREFRPAREATYAAGVNVRTGLQCLGVTRPTALNGGSVPVTVNGFVEF